MKNLFIFIYNDCNHKDNNYIDKDNYYTKIIDNYISYYDNFIVFTQSNSIINNIIRKEKLSSYFELDNNENINLFVLNNLNNMEYDNYVFLYGNFLDYNDNILNPILLGKTISIDLE